MASVLPNKDDDLIRFFELREGKWEDSAAAIGLSAAQIASLKANMAAARAAFEAAAAAKVAARDATSEKTDKVALLRSFGGNLVGIIKAFADAQPNPAAVYTAASIPLPGTTPTPSLKTATNVVADPNADGTVTVKWKAEDQAQGAVYTVWRRLGGTPGAQFAQIATTGERKLIDYSVPAGTAVAAYYLRTVKGTETLPPSEQATVNFGSTGASGVNSAVAA